MEQRQQPPLPTKPDEGFQWKRWAVGIAALALIVLVAQNSQKVEVNFFFAETRTPLVFALLVAAILGGLVGWLAPKLRRRERGRDRSHD
ncbi:MAG: LapA family protein [bacterium]